MEEIYQRAGETDNILLLYLKEVAAQMKYPPKSFRSCRAIMSLEKKYGLSRLVAACACASDGRMYGYNEVRGILERGDEASYMAADGEETTAANDYKPHAHKNLRGKEYYAQQQTNNEKTEDNGNE